MNWISRVAFLSIALAASSVAQPLTRDALERSIFQSIRVKPGAQPELLLQFNRNGVRFSVYRNGREEKVNEYRETISLRIGENLSLSEHHGGLQFLPLPKPLDQNGWLLESFFDSRSFGGKETSRHVILLILHGAQLRFVEPDPNFDPKLPPTDPTLQRIVKLIAETPPPVITHSLLAETPVGKTAPPFPVSATRLLLNWKLLPGASPEVIEVRWIAVDTGAAAPKDYLIASSKSEPGKIEDVFTLSKPTNGFPPGKYRIELLQAGKTIHTEDFEIR